MKLGCVVVEDSELEAELIASFIRRIDFLELKGMFNEAILAQQFILENQVDLIISDIMLPDITGLQMIKTLKNPPQVIFTTSFSDYAADGFDLEATDYIVKPVTFERFLSSANRALNMFNLVNKDLSKKSEDNYFFIRSDFSFVKVNFNEILYIESIKDYVRVVTTSGSHMTSMTMKMIEEQIPMEEFIRIHRSHIVKINKIDAVKNDEVVIGKQTLSVSDSFKDALYKKVVEAKIIKR
jgi:two-component system LytT family response regulator